MKNNKTVIKKILGPSLLFLTALVWGSSFVSQSVGMEKVEAFTFGGIRTLLGAFALLPVVLVISLFQRRKMTPEMRIARKAKVKKTIFLGLFLGLAFCAATTFQQFAFNYSTSGKIAFITATYMFFVPIIGLILRKRVPIITIICIVVGFAGMYLLCIDPAEGISINIGEILTLICAVFFAIHILLVEKISQDVDGPILSCTQFFVAGTINILLMFIFEKPVIADILAVAPAILYSGIMSCAVAYTLQIIGQKYTEATIASLIMCLESVFAAIFGAILLHEQMSVREIVGCIVMFAAIVVAQLGTSGLFTKKKR